jgi:hypothetical protein
MMSGQSVPSQECGVSSRRNAPRPGRTDLCPGRTVAATRTGSKYRGQVTLGIAIITLNRPAVLARTVRAVIEHTTDPFVLVIADDGSREPAVERWARENIPVVTGTRRGCAWNKNRALWFLLEHTPCDPILLLEDDTVPQGIGWNSEWREAAMLWQHVNYCYYFDPPPPHLRRKRGQPPPLGEGSPARPFLTADIGGQCTITTRAGLKEVGFLDPRFRGYGFEHLEWSWRFWNTYHDVWGLTDRLLPCLDRGVGVTWPPSHFVREEYAVNGMLYARLAAGCEMGDRRPRLPWQNEEERAVLEGEVETSARRCRRAADRPLPNERLPGHHESARLGARAYRHRWDYGVNAAERARTWRWRQPSSVTERLRLRGWIARTAPRSR